MPECHKKSPVLVLCSACSLVCCYKCATEATLALPKHPSELVRPCDRPIDRWPQPPSGEDKQKKPRGEIGLKGRSEPVNWRNPETNSTGRSPNGHIWGPA